MAELAAGPARRRIPDAQLVTELREKNMQLRALIRSKDGMLNRAAFSLNRLAARLSSGTESSKKKEKDRFARERREREIMMERQREAEAAAHVREVVASVCPEAAAAEVANRIAERIRKEKPIPAGYIPTGKRASDKDTSKGTPKKKTPKQTERKGKSNGKAAGKGKTK